jgi:DNA-binding GntR family transcriptional regulator
MGPDDRGRRASGGQTAEALATVILQRIADGDLPAGLVLEPSRLSVLFNADAASIAAALELLEDAGATVRIDNSWMVRTDRQPGRHEVLQRAAPLLRAITSLAAERISPAEAAGLLAAYDRFAGLAGDGSAEARADGYRLFLRRLAEASGSSFHALGIATLLDDTGVLVDRFIAQLMLAPGRRPPDDPLARLAQALMASDAQEAATAIDDHLILLGRHIDCAVC